MHDTQETELSVQSNKGSYWKPDNIFSKDPSSMERKAQTLDAQ
jgi:hypothetical protein